MFDVEIGDGSGRRSFWIHPSVPLQFHFFGSRQPRINRAWVEELMQAASGPERAHDPARADRGRRAVVAGGVAHRAGGRPSRRRSDRRAAYSVTSSAVTSVPATVSVSTSMCSTSTLPSDRSAPDSRPAAASGTSTGPVSKCSATSRMPPVELAEFASSSIHSRLSSCGLRVVEDEPQRDRRVQPDRAAPARLVVGVAPRHGEALVASQLGRDDDLQVRERAVLDVDRRRAAAVVDRSHAPTITRGGACYRLRAASTPP